MENLLRTQRRLNYICGRGKAVYIYTYIYIDTRVYTFFHFLVSRRLALLSDISGARDGKVRIMDCKCYADLFVVSATARKIRRRGTRSFARAQKGEISVFRIYLPGCTWFIYLYLQRAPRSNVWQSKNIVFFFFFVFSSSDFFSPRLDICAFVENFASQIRRNSIITGEKRRRSLSPHSVIAQN